MTNKPTYALRRAVVCATMVAVRHPTPTAAQATPSNSPAHTRETAGGSTAAKERARFRHESGVTRSARLTYVVRYGLWRYANGGVASVATCRSGERGGVRQLAVRLT